MPIQRLQDEFDASTMDMVIEEAAPGESLHGMGLLGRFRGPMAFENAMSRNKRWYPNGHWEHTLQSEAVRNKLADRNMYGTIGHDLNIDEAAFRDGKISHIITGLTLDRSGKVIGEGVILDSHAGRMLNSVMRAKSKMYVSSRAYGGFKGEQHGVPVVDTENYNLHGFDIVLNPGFLQASPSIQENVALMEDYNAVFGGSTGSGSGAADRPMHEDAPASSRGGAMPPEISETLTALSVSNGRLQVELSEALDARKTAETNAATSQGSLTTVQKELAALKESVQKDAQELVALRAFKAKMESIGAGDPERTEAALSNVDATMDKFEALIRPHFENVHEALTFAAEVAETIGIDPERAKNVLLMSEQALQEYQELGTAEEIRETLEDVDGTLADVTDMLLEDSAETLAEELDIEVERVLDMMEKGLSEDDIRATVQGLQESVQVRNRYRIPEREERQAAPEGEGRPDPFDRPKGASLMERFSGR